LTCGGRPLHPGITGGHCCRGWLGCQAVRDQVAGHSRGGRPFVGVD
jgi:hypothetical protein